MPSIFSGMPMEALSCLNHATKARDASASSASAGAIPQVRASLPSRL